MRLNKSDALLLSKVLFYYERLTSAEKTEGRYLDGFDDLLLRLENFLISNDFSERSEGHSGENSSIDLDDEGDESPDDEDDDEEEDEVPSPDEKIAPSQLHELTVVEVEVDDKTVSLEFEEVEESTEESYVDVLIGDGEVIEYVQLIRRTGKVLELWADNGGWHGVFEAKKLPKAWKNLFKDGVVYEVV